MDERVEDGKKIRFDCTVTEADIHDPSDGELLWDVVRVLTRLMSSAREEFGLAFSDRTRRAKRRALGVWNAKSDKVRRRQCVDLLAATEDTASQFRETADLADEDVRDLIEEARRQARRKITV